MFKPGECNLEEKCKDGIMQLGLGLI